MAGYPAAMFSLAVAYDSGTGLPASNKEAVHWYRKAADAGNVAAMQNLATLHAVGDGLAVDETEAVRWRRKAASAGDIASMLRLARMYDNGISVARDSREAAAWMFKALEQRDFDARQIMLSQSQKWSVDFRRSLQELLQEAGIYKGGIDGAFAGTTLDAISILAE